MKKIIFLFILALSLLTATLFLNNKTKVVAKSCKTENAECSVNDSDKFCCQGFTCADFNVHSGNGKCKANPTLTPTPTIEEPTVTPTPTEEITPTPTEEQGCKEDCVTETPTPTPTDEVTPTPTPEDHQEGLTSNFSSNFSQSGNPTCPDLKPTKVQDVWYSDYQIAGATASLKLNWGLNSNYNKVVIAYGDEKGQWLYGVPETENNGSYTIGNLTPNKTYWFSVAYRNGCAVGEFSDPVDP